MENKDVWKSIFEADPLFKPQREKLSEIIDVQKVSDFIINSQTEQGYFDVKSPMFNTTFLCVSILNDCDKKISENTIKFIESLQAGSMGFSEMPGEMPWTDRTYYALEMMKIIKKEPRAKEKMIEFHQSLQNDDGGFCSIGTQYSNLIDTFTVVQILSLLGLKPKSADKAINYLKSQNVFSNVNTLYNSINCMKILRHNLEIKEVEEIKNFLNNVRANISQNGTYEDIFYFLMIQKYIGDVQHYPELFTARLKNVMQNISSFHVQDLYYITKIFKLFNKIGDISETVCNIAIRYEMPKGGFFMPGEIYIFKNNMAFHTLFLLDELSKINAEKYLEWLLKSAVSGAWGSVPNNQTDRDLYTRSSIATFRISDISKLDEVMKRAIVRKLTNKLENISVKFEYSSYHFARLARELFETFFLLNEFIDDARLIGWIKMDIVKNVLMRFWNEDGGFGDPSRSFIYTTFLAVRALHLGENYLFNEFNNKDIKWLDKIRDKISEWILSCQNSDGGFGPRPGEPSNIQATFYALRSLFMLDKKIEKEENLIKWLKSNQNQDGGFSMNGLSSDISFTFYAVGSLIIISS